MARLSRSRGSRDGSLVAVPQEQHDHQRQIEHRVGRKRRDRAGGRDDDAADRRPETSRDVVADAVERDRGRQRLRGHLLADGGLPGRSEQRHAAADDEAERQQVFGVTRPSQASTVSAVAPASAIDSETSATMRRSYMSAMAPAGIAISMTGSIKAVCTSATLSADEVICVIAQAAPTPWIRMPRLESRLASQMRRNTECRSGAATPSAAKSERFRLFGHGRFRCPSVIGFASGESVMPAKICLSSGEPAISGATAQLKVLKATGGDEMRLSRRTILKGAGALPACQPIRLPFALAQTAPAASPAAAEIPPVLFVHGHGDHAALWITTLWRMESNGVPRDRMFAINFTDPLARPTIPSSKPTVPRPKTSAANSPRPSRN